MAIADKPLRKFSEEKLKDLYIHLGVYLLVNISLAFLNVARNPEHLWFQWVAMGWGIGMVFHALLAFDVIHIPHRMKRNN